MKYKCKTIISLWIEFVVEVAGEMGNEQPQGQQSSKLATCLFVLPKFPSVLERVLC